MVLHGGREQYEKIVSEKHTEHRFRRKLKSCGPSKAKILSIFSYLQPLRCYSITHFSTLKALNIGIKWGYEKVDKIFAPKGPQLLILRLKLYSLRFPETIYCPYTPMQSHRLQKT